MENQTGSTYHTGEQEMDGRRYHAYTSENAPLCTRSLILIFTGCYLCMDSYEMPMESGAGLLLRSVSKVIDNKSAPCITVSDVGGNRQTRSHSLFITVTLP